VSNFILVNILLSHSIHFLLLPHPSPSSKLFFRFLRSSRPENTWVNQVKGNRTVFDNGQWILEMESRLPWNGRVRLSLIQDHPSTFTLHLRIQSWARQFSIQLSNKKITYPPYRAFTRKPNTASGYDPRNVYFLYTAPGAQEIYSNSLLNCLSFRDEHPTTFVVT
jgi:hypothetical protein